MPAICRDLAALVEHDFADAERAMRAARGKRCGRPP